jgi:hypothetical protein
MSAVCLYFQCIVISGCPNLFLAMLFGSYCFTLSSIPPVVSVHCYNSTYSSMGCLLHFYDVLKLWRLFWVISKLFLELCVYMSKLYISEMDEFWNEKLIMYTGRSTSCSKVPLLMQRPILQTHSPRLPVYHYYCTHSHPMS